MNFIKLNAIPSTSDYLKERIGLCDCSDITFVTAEHQTAGRGQRGNTWQSEKYKNLTFSVLIKSIPANWITTSSLSMAVSLMVFDTLKHFFITDLTVKWPNDILSGNKKVSGILIENLFSNNQTCHAIIGVGINVNQTVFKDLPQASSMKNISGKIFDKDEVLTVFTKYFNQYIKCMYDAQEDKIKLKYEENLFRIHKPSTFEDYRRNNFTGIIRGVDNSGKLQIEIEDKRIISFHHKEVFLRY